MSNAVIAYGNVADGCTLSGGAWVENFPLNNVKNRQISKVARSVNTLPASTTFTATLAAPAPLGAFSLEGTNASTKAQVRWRTYSDAALTVLVYDSGVVDAYPNGSLSWGYVLWGSPNWWTHKPLPSEIVRFQRGARHIAPARLTAQYVKCEVFDTVNVESYFQAGRLFLADTFQPQYNIKVDPRITLRSRSLVERSPGGEDFSSKRRPDIVYSLEFDALSEAETMRVLDLQALVDVTGEVLFVWDPSEAAFRFRKSVFGELRDLDPLLYPDAAQRSTTIQIEGVI